MRYKLNIYFVFFFFSFFEGRVSRDYLCGIEDSVESKLSVEVGYLREFNAKMPKVIDQEPFG